MDANSRDRQRERERERERERKIIDKEEKWQSIRERKLWRRRPNVWFGRIRFALKMVFIIYFNKFLMVLSFFGIITG